MTKEEAETLSDPNEVRLIYYREAGTKMLYWAVVHIREFREDDMEFMIHFMQDAGNPLNKWGMNAALPYAEIKDII